MIALGKGALIGISVRALRSFLQQAGRKEIYFRPGISRKGAALSRSLPGSIPARLFAGRINPRSGA